jgi:energy-coupling factor transport system substrate-specific component
MTTATLHNRTGNSQAIPLSWKTRAMIAITAVLGLAAFCWPLFIDPYAALNNDRTGQTSAPIIMGVIMLIVIGVVLIELTNEEMTVKTLAMLGVLCAVNAVLRPLGSGTGGMETVFFLLVIAGRVFGPGFGFTLGCLSLFASALLTAGVGPWLPYQMLASGFVGLLAGLLPGKTLRGGKELGLLIGYSVLASFFFGYLMDFAFWPFIFGGSASQVGFDPTASPWANLQTFFVVNTATSLGWNIGRAITCAVLLALLGKPLLRIFRRTARRAHFT